MTFQTLHHFLFGTLRGRLILGVAAVHAVMMALFITDLTLRQRAMLLDRQAEAAFALSQALATSAAVWIAADDVSGLQELVEVQRRYPELLFAVLTDERGHVLADTDKAHQGLYLLDLPREARQTALSRSPALVDVAAPAVIGGKHVGWARVGIGQKAVGGKLAKITRNGVGYALAAIFVGSGIAWLMGRRITRRLYAIQQTIDEVRAGNQLARSPIAGADEAAGMAREFNSMLDALAEREAELRASEANFRSLIRKVQTAIVLHDSLGRIVDSNPLAQQLLGFSADKLLGKVLLDPEWRFLREDGSALPVAEFPVSRVLATRKPLRGQVLGVRQPNQDPVAWVLVNAEPEFSAAGDIVLVIVSFVDITERKRLEEQREQYFKFFTLSADPMCIADPFGCFRQVNPALMNLTGYSESELISQPFLEFVVPEDRQRTADEMLLQVADRPTMNFENRYRCKDGSTICLSWTAYFDRKNGVTYATARDITAHKQAEEALHVASNYNRSLIEASLDPLVTIGPDGKITDVNTATEAATGCTRVELVGRDFSDYFTDPARAQAGYQQVFREGVVRDYPLELRHRNGKVMSVLYNASVYRDENGKVSGVFAAARDITARKQAEEEIQKLNRELDQRVTERTTQLEAANRELEAFSYSVSHDLRAPLRSIDGFSRIVLEDCAAKLDEEGRNNLHRVRAASQRMGSLIDDLLKLSRITRGEMHRGPVDLSALARTVAAALRQAEPGRNVEFVIAPDLTARADASLLRIALENLLGNAWKFTAKQPAARIEVGRTTSDASRGTSDEQGHPVTRHPSPVTFFVRDNGAGFNMAYAQKLFGAFQRLHTTDEFPGTGVGLATVQRIIHRHGGRVWAEGEIGKGATFYFSLPG